MNLNAQYQKDLLAKWGKVLESGNQKIASVEDKLVVAKVLENTYRFYKRRGFFTEATNTINPTIDTRTPGYQQAVSGGGVLTSNDYILPNVVMPMLRRIFPTLIAHELVSVQPLTGPVGFAFALRVKGPNESGYPTPSKDYEYGFEAASHTTGFSKAEVAGEFKRTAGPKGTTVNVSEAEGFGGPYDPAVPGTAKFGRFGQSGVPGQYPMASIGFIKASVTADERKLGSEWTPEMAEDLEAMHGIDIETEMVNHLSFQIGMEIDQEIVDNICDAAAFNETDPKGNKAVWKWEPQYADGLDQMGRISTLMTTVTKAANDIAITTRMGAGNFVIASNNVCSAIQQLGTQKLVTDGKSMPSVPASSVGALTKEGLINEGRQLLVRDSYAEVDYAVVGYKGTQTGDSGIIYCPYVPVTLVKTVDPFTLSPRIGARTRYGIMNNPWDANRFYRLIRVNFDTPYQFGAERYFFGGQDNSVVEATRSISENEKPQAPSASADSASGIAALEAAAEAAKGEKGE